MDEISNDTIICDAQIASELSEKAGKLAELPVSQIQAVRATAMGQVIADGVSKLKGRT